MESGHLSHSNMPVQALSPLLKPCTLTQFSHNVKIGTAYQYDFVVMFMISSILVLHDLVLHDHDRDSRDDDFSYPHFLSI